MISITKLLVLLLSYHASALRPVFDSKQLNGDKGDIMIQSRRSTRYFRPTHPSQRNNQDYSQTPTTLPTTLSKNRDNGKQKHVTPVPVSHTQILGGVLIGLAISVILCVCCQGECLIIMGVATIIIGIVLAFYFTYTTTTLRLAFLALLGCCIAGSAWIGIGQHKIYAKVQAEAEERRWIKRTAMKLSKKEWQGYELVISKRNRVPLQNRGEDESETEFLAGGHPSSFDATATL